MPNRPGDDARTNCKLEVLQGLFQNLIFSLKPAGRAPSECPRGLPTLYAGAFGTARDSVDSRDLVLSGGFDAVSEYLELDGC